MPSYAGAAYHSCSHSPKTASLPGTEYAILQCTTVLARNRGRSAETVAGPKYCTLVRWSTERISNFHPLHCLYIPFPSAPPAPAHLQLFEINLTGLVSVKEVKGLCSRSAFECKQLVLF